MAKRTQPGTPNGARMAQASPFRRAALQEVFRIFQEHGYVFRENSMGIRLWHMLVALFVAYSTVFLPLARVFEQARWAGHLIFDRLIDAALMIDVAVKFRTSYADRGYEVTDKWQIASHYLRTWLICDVLSSIPFSLIPQSSTPLRTDGHA